MDAYLLLTPLLLLPLVWVLVFVGCAYLVGLHDYEPPKDITPPPPPPAPAKLGGPGDLVVSGRYYDAEFRPVVYTAAAHTWKSYPADRVFHDSKNEAPDVLIFAESSLKLRTDDRPDRGHLVNDPQAAPDQPAVYLFDEHAFRKLNVVSKSLVAEGHLVHMFTAADSGPFDAIPVSGPYFSPNETTLAIFRPTIARWQFKTLDDVNPLNAASNPHGINFKSGRDRCRRLLASTWRPAPYAIGGRPAVHGRGLRDGGLLTLAGGVSETSRRRDRRSVPPATTATSPASCCSASSSLAALWFFFSLADGQSPRFSTCPGCAGGETRGPARTGGPAAAGGVPAERRQWVRRRAAQEAVLSADAAANPSDARLQR